MTNDSERSLATLSKDEHAPPDTHPSEWTQEQLIEWCQREADAWLGVRDGRKASVMRYIALRLRAQKWR